MQFENMFYLDRCKDIIKEQILDLLDDCDDDFCPPLRKRVFLSEKCVTSSEINNSILRYYHWIMDSSGIIVEEGNKVIGFVAYTVSPDCLYVKNILVAKNYRNRGIASKLYSMILEVNRTVCIRTWSTNKTNIKLLEDNGFTIKEVIKDDRGDGIDTIFYVREK